MNKCLNCGAEIVQKNGGKERKFCDNNNACKQAYFNKTKKQPKYVKLSSFEALKELNEKLIKQLEDERQSQNKAISGALENKPATTRGINKITQPYGSNEPERIKGEGSLDYKLRLAEWKEKQNAK